MDEIWVWWKMNISRLVNKYSPCLQQQWLDDGMYPSQNPGLSGDKSLQYPGLPGTLAQPHPADRKPAADNKYQLMTKLV